LLIPVSLLYWLIMAVRNWFFEIGILRITKVGVPVVSVGNISAGGVGKTPIVELLVEKLNGKQRLAVVTRGYKRKTTGTIVVSNGLKILAAAREAGDEAIQLAEKYKGLVVVADEKRVRGAKKAAELGAELILLDDGFQHRYLHRDIDLVVLAARDLLNGDCLLPAGNRRETFGSLNRADAIFISRCQDSSMTEMVKIKSGNFGKPVILVRTKLRSFRNPVTGRALPRTELNGKKNIAFSGIGDPKSFEELLKENGLITGKILIYPDHYWYSGRDIEMISRTKKELNADLVITTEKDAARLKDGHSDFLEKENVVVAEIFQEILEGEEELNFILEKCIKENKHTVN
jgi:tetraacyldisaccharide 4'-kinase